MKELLKIVTCGSVDDGKSTLIGHLMFNIRAVFSDQQAELEQIRRATGAREIDYSLLLDGLEAEREQGITIDVAYRFFSTPSRSFIIADCPGHNEYTRNMAVGASFADAAIILVDATRGITRQTLRHYRICSLMGIRNFIFAINKMDLVGYRQDAFRQIAQQFASVQSEDGGERRVCIPVSAKAGDNITEVSSRMEWYKGLTLLDYLEATDVQPKHEAGILLPVQRVSRTPSGTRGYQGCLESGCLRVGEQVTIYPSKTASTVTELYQCEKKTDSAECGSQVTVALADDIDISRGCVIASAFRPSVSTNFKASVLWIDDEPLRIGKSYFLRLGTAEIPASCTAIYAAGETAADFACKNDIVDCTMSTASPLVIDTFAAHRSIGEFILIDRQTHATVACGIVREVLDHDYIYPAQLHIDRKMRAGQKNQTPFAVWLTGLPASGKTTIANLLEKKLFSLGCHTMILDGDNLRSGMNKDLGFSERDRSENIRRTAEAVKLLNDAGLIAIVSLVSPFRCDRAAAAEIIGAGFTEVYVAASAETCQKRDKKGYYNKAKSGLIENFTGISGKYESPDSPDVYLDAERLSPKECVEQIVSHLRAQGLL